MGYINPYFNNLREAKYIDNKCYYDMLFHQVSQPYLVLKRMNGIGVVDIKVDNYASGGVSCGITPDGYLKKFAYNKKGERVTIHPYTGVVFEGCKIPSYDKAVELVKNTHPTISHFRSVSWDIAITEEGEPILIEANLCRGGIDLLQLSNGPLFGDDAKMILDEVFNK